MLLRTFGDIGGATRLYYNGLVIFTISGGLWRTDGTPEGTFELASRRGFSNYESKVMDGVVYICAAAGPTFQETDLLRTDGTVAGTRLVKQIPGTLQSWGVGSDALYLATYTGRWHATPGQASIWKTDGTATNTVQVGPVGTTPPPSFYNAFGDLYQREAGLGVQPIRRQNPATGAFELLAPTPSIDLIQYGFGAFYKGQLYGPASSDAIGTELCRFDGTPIRDLNPGPATGASFTRPVVVNDVLYFSGNDGITGPELWQTDGSASGTRLVSDLVVGAAGSTPFNLTLFRGELYFDAANGTLYKLSPDPAANAEVPTTVSSLTLSTPLYDCTSGRLTIQTTGGSGSAVEYRVTGLSGWSASRRFELPDAHRTGVDLTLEARQKGYVVSRPFTSGCSGSQFNVSKSEPSLTVFLYPNPVGERFTVGVSGAAGQLVGFDITDANGRSLLKQSRQVELDQHTEKLLMPTEAAGLYLLKVSAGGQTRTVKLVRQ